MLTRLLLILLLCLAGCSVRLGKATPDDKLRERVLELEKDNRLLGQRVAELEGELARQTDIGSELPEAIRRNTPHVAAIYVSALSHLRDQDDDGELDTLLLYLKPEDGLGRFVQMVGRLSVNASLVPPEAPARTIGLLVLEPNALRAAYRSSFTGTHYTIEMPVDVPRTSAARLTIELAFEDGLTGQRVTGDGEVDLPAGRGASK